MKSNREKRGQFIIIAVMLIAIMIISIGALMHGAITYYRHEPWEEYSTLIGDIEVNSQRVVEFFLADYTNSGGGNLDEALSKWQHDLTVIYPSSGIRLTWTDPPTPTTGSNPTAKVSEFNLDIESIGLKGYKFSITAALSLKVIQDATTTPNNIVAVVKSESGEPVTGLRIDNFLINGVSKPTLVVPYYDEANTLIYRIQFEEAPIEEVKVTDQRGISAVYFL
jgi:hypothetical protein